MVKTRRRPNGSHTVHSPTMASFFASVRRVKRLLLGPAPSRHKPIDRWFAAGALVMGVILYLLPKPTPVIVVALLVLSFLALVHPAWNFWWIEKHLWRRLLSVVILAVAVLAFGFHVWPRPPVQTNRELKEQSMLIVGRIRAMSAFYNGKIQDLEAKRARKEIDMAAFGPLWQEQLERGGEEFERESLTEALIVLWKLRERIPLESRKHIIRYGLPDLLPADPRAGSVSLYGIMGKKFDFMTADLMANEIEQLAKMLPND